MGSLSGGEKVKLRLLRLLAEQPDVLLLDEPTRNLSPLSNPVIRRALAEYGVPFSALPTAENTFGRSAPPYTS
mgnify:CR=1 FL=1